MDKLMQGAPRVLQNLLFQISFEIPDLIFELVFFLIMAWLDISELM